MPAVRTGERACAQPGCRALEHSTPCTHLLEASALPLMQLKRVQSAPLQRPSPWTHTWAVCQQQLPPVLALAQVEGPGHARPQPAACHPHPAAANTGQVGVGVGGRKQGHARVNVDLAASSCANGAAGPPVCFTLTTDHPCNWGQTMCTALTGLPINSQPAWPGNQTSHACARREALRSRRLLQPLQALLQRRAVQRRAVLGPAGMDGDARAAGAERRLGAMAQHISWE